MVASPWMTLTKSYTTRRSQPMIRSRLRRPTSKSITAVLCPRIARPDAKLALEVVFPTPPLPDVTTMILATNCSFQSFPGGMNFSTRIRIEGHYLQAVADQLHLGG